MKYLKLLSLSGLALIVAILLFTKCGNDENQQDIVDMIKTRTMGLAYLEEDKLTEAEATFKKLIKLAPKEVLGYTNLGLVYLRMGKFEEAEQNFRKALEFEPRDPEIHLNYAELLMLTNKDSTAIDLLEQSIRFNSDHLRTLYKLGQIYARSNDNAMRMRSKDLFAKVVSFLPTNVVVRLELIELLLEDEKGDEAGGYFEQLKSQLPEFPKGADDFYEKALSFMLQNNSREALPPFNIFRNFLKPTPLFKANFDELKGVGGPLIGTPLITFHENKNLTGQSQQMLLEAIQFTDATEAAGLNELPVVINSSTNKISKYIMTIADFDGNGTQDIYASVWNEKEKSNFPFLLKNDFGKYLNISDEAGVQHEGRDSEAIFTDYDNDGFLDLFLVNDIQNVLYYHYEPRRFRNVTKNARIESNVLSNAACFADFDHDGDLDLYLANQSSNTYFRNNLDGSFTETSQKMALSGLEIPSKDLAYGDFDDDGDIDLFVLNSTGSNVIYSNLRQGQFADVTSDWEIPTEIGSISSATGDYNNDGLLDLIITNSGSSSYTLFTNFEGKKYEKDNRSSRMESILKEYICSDVHFFDFDNDGYLDLIFAGKSKNESVEKPGVLLFRNNGNGIFENASNLLPQNLSGGSQIVIADYNEDGDQDIFFSGDDGRIHLLRNDGGNANNYLKVQLVGLRTGSGKNNYFGIGAKVEVKAGELYQSHIVTEPVIHFGLGQKTKADVVRVLWTNGVPQNLFEPGSNQSLLEEQVLKGSCPFLYAWNGDQYEFVTDVLWRSALGMPLGIMGGETAYAFSNPSEDYFKIPGEMLKEKDGIYSLNLTAELWETAYFDEVNLLVLDHPDSSDVYIDERFTPPPYPPLKYHHISNKKYPKSIVDEKGNDLGKLTRYKDNLYVAVLSSEKYQGITKLHDLVLDLGNLKGEKEISLYLNGWVFPTDASINMAVSQSSFNLIHPPSLQVKDKWGRWETVIENISFPMGKNKTMILDLADKFLSENYQIRIRTSMQIYWDYIFYSLGESDKPMRISKLTPSSADLHYRGFSSMFRKGGRYGPFWFDYYDVSTDPKWRDLLGYYTRYGDVKELLTESDSKYIITNAGDEISLEFDTEELPDLPEGWRRDFVIYTNGWLKDGDLNTAKGQTVEPLPFIGMSKYPYGENENYPDDNEYQQYLKKYNTRKVTTESFKKLIMNN